MGDFPPQGSGGGGGGGLSTKTVSSNTTTSDEDLIAVNTSGGAVTITLASADVTDGNSIVIVHVDGSNAVTVDTEGSETIDPNADSSKVINNAGDAVRFTGDGSNWDSSLAPEYDSLTTDQLSFANEYLNTGEFVPVALIQDGANESTSSSSYGRYSASRTQPLFQWDREIAPGNQQGHVALFSHCDPSTDQIDFTVRNYADSENALEVTGVTGGSSYRFIGEADYTPTSTGSPIELGVSFRNGDNSTTVDLFSATIYVGRVL